MSEAKTLYLQAEAVLDPKLGRERAMKRSLNALLKRALTPQPPASIEDEGQRRAYTARSSFIQRCEAHLLSSLLSPERFACYADAKEMYPQLLDANQEMAMILAVIWVRLMELGDGLAFPVWLANHQRRSLPLSVQTMAQYLNQTSPLLAAIGSNVYSKANAKDPTSSAIGGNVVMLTAVRAAKDEPTTTSSPPLEFVAPAATP
jgi:hypothetical protein